jgi:hypothetical protein
MITIPQDEKEGALVREIIKLNKTFQHANSWWRALLRGMLYAVGSVIGFAIIAFISGVYVWRVARTADLGSKLEKAVSSTIEKQIKTQVTNGAQKIQAPITVDQNLINAFLKTQR